MFLCTVVIHLCSFSYSLCSKNSQWWCCLGNLFISWWMSDTTW